MKEVISVPYITDLIEKYRPEKIVLSLKDFESFKMCLSGCTTSDHIIYNRVRIEPVPLNLEGILDCTGDEPKLLKIVKV